MNWFKNLPTPFVILHQSIAAVPTPPPREISGAFSLIVYPRGRVVAYPRAFDGLVMFHLSPLSLCFNDKFIVKDDKFVLDIAT